MAPRPQHARRKGRPARSMKIDTLPRDVQERYEREVLSVAGTLAKEAQRWLAAQGHAVSLAAVLRHRRRWAKRRKQDAQAAAAAEAVRRMAERHHFTPADLAAGRALRARHLLFDRLCEAYAQLNRVRKPAPAHRIITFARAVRMYVP